jgi:Peptidase A4 family
MRRRWPVLAATIPLMLGWAVATAHTASAAAPPGGPTGTVQSGGTVQPGGPVSSLTTPGMPSGTVTPQVSGQQPQAFPGGGQNSGQQDATVTSSNWAGYVAAGSNGTFTSVSSNWTEPAGHCTGGGGRYAAFWVGLDGYTSTTVEQIGTEVDCSGYFPRYYAWSEIYPGAAVNFTNPVSPGDQFSASVTYQASNTFNLLLKDNTKGWTQSVSGSTVGSAARSSAEAIAEAPCCTASNGVLPLTNFGTVSFNSAMANGRSMSTYNPTEIVMPNTSVSPMNSAGNFTVSYNGFAGFPGFPWRGGF